MKAKRNACRTKKDISLRNRRAFSRRARFEPLEARQMLSAGNLFAEFVGTLAPASPVERLDVQIAPEALGLMRDKALLGFQVRGRDGQTFDPAAVQILRPDGSAVVPEFAADDLPGRTDSVVVAELAEGNYTIVVRGSLSARSQFFMDVFLVGDANGDHRVGRDDLDFIRQSYGASFGDARYNLAADANLDGRITAIDLSLARRNESDCHVPAAPLLLPAAPEGSSGSTSAPSAPPAAATIAPDPTAPVAGVVPTRGYDPDAPMRFYESTYGLVQCIGQDAVFHVPGEYGDTTALIFSWDFREAGYNNSLGYYYTDDINTLHTVFAAGEVPNGTTTSVLKTVEADCGRDISFFIVQNGNAATWYATDTLNADNYAHFLLTQLGDPNYKSDWLQYKVEDLSPTIANPYGYENDADYNDVVFSVAVPVVNLVSIDSVAKELNDNELLEDDTAAFAVTCTVTLPEDLRVYLQFGGTADREGYQLSVGSTPVTDSVVIPAGYDSVLVTVTALQNDMTANPEDDPRNAVIAIGAAPDGSYVVGPNDSQTSYIYDTSVWTIKATDTRKLAFPSYTVVHDTAPTGPVPEEGYTVVIVGGGRTDSGTSERDKWATDARTAFPDAYVYNDIKNATEFADVIAAFPAGSVSKIILSGHGTYPDSVGIQPTNNNTQTPAGYDQINAATLGALPSAKVDAVIAALRGDALIDIQSCGGYAKDNNGDLVDYSADCEAAAEELAALFLTDVRFALGSMRAFDVAPTDVKIGGTVLQGRWVTVSPW